VPWNSNSPSCPVEQDSVAAEEQGLLRRLATDLPRLWNHESAPFDLKKRILRTVIKEIVIEVEETRLRVLIHWKGGQHSELSLRKRRPGEHRWTAPAETVDLIRQLARRMSDKQIAAQLNRLGVETAKGHTWTRIRVGNFPPQTNTTAVHSRVALEVVSGEFLVGWVETQLWRLAGSRP
jgi:hypothetical protein